MAIFLENCGKCDFETRHQVFVFLYTGGRNPIEATTEYVKTPLRI